MRYSSMKSTVIALSITVSLFAAVPTATAGPASGARDTQVGRTRDERSVSDRLAAVRQLINRALRRIGVNNGPSIPIPKDVLPTPQD